MSRARIDPRYVHKPVRVSVFHRGKLLAERVFQHTPIHIGRLEDNDVVLPFDFASRYHLELRYLNDQWVAADLGSKNGFAAGGMTKLRQHALGTGGEIRIQEIEIRIASIEARALDPRLLASASSEPTQVSPLPREDDLDMTLSGAPRKAALSVAEVSIISFQTDPEASTSREKALQMMVLWNDRVLETRDFAMGERIEWNFSGSTHVLGIVSTESTTVKIPKGCRPAINRAADIQDDEDLIELLKRPLTVTPHESASFQVGEQLYVLFRYVARSRAFKGEGARQKAG